MVFDMQFGPDEEFEKTYTFWGAILLISALLFAVYVVCDLIVALN